MSNKLYRSSEDKPDSLWRVNKYINNCCTETPSDILNSKIDKNRDIFREQQRKWHPSKLEGYISDEFRNVELAD